MMYNLDPEKYMRVQLSRHVWLCKGKIGGWLDKVNSLPVDELIEFYNDWVKRQPRVKTLSAFIASTIFTMVMRKSLHCYNENFGKYVSKIDRITSNILTKNVTNPISSTSTEQISTENIPDDDSMRNLSDSTHASNSDTDSDSGNDTESCDDESSVDSNSSNDTMNNTEISEEDNTKINEDDEMKNHKKSLPKYKRQMRPKRFLESKRIFELLVRMKLHQIVPNRRIKDFNIYDMIPSITSPLIEKQQQQKRNKT